MPTRFRKSRKHRGSRTCGWGQIGQHRKTGAKGGRGRTGRHKHKWTWVLKYDRDYFGKHGFYRPNRRELRAINLIQLSTIVEGLEREGMLKTLEDRPFIDLSKLGFDKLIGRGRVNRPLTIAVESWTEKAERLIKEAGGILVKPQKVEGAEA